MDGVIDAIKTTGESGTAHRDIQVLIVADDSATVAALASEIVTKMDAHITIVDSIAEARVLISSEGFDLVLANRDLDDGSGIDLIKPLGTPVILVEKQSSAGTTVEAFRSGAADVVCPSEDAGTLIDSIGRVVTASRRQRHTLGRNRRLRRVSSRLIKDRRELRQRVDLICRDLVQAYQSLAEKVVTTADEIADRN